MRTGMTYEVYCKGKKFTVQTVEEYKLKPVEIEPIKDEPEKKREARYDKARVTYNQDFRKKKEIIDKTVFELSRDYLKETLGNCEELQVITIKIIDEGKF